MKKIYLTAIGGLYALTGRYCLDQTGHIDFEG